MRNPFVRVMPRGIIATWCRSINHFTALERQPQNKKKQCKRLIAGPHGDPLQKQQHTYASVCWVGDLDALAGPIRGKPRQNSEAPHLSESSRRVPSCTFGVGKGFAPVVMAPEGPHHSKKLRSNVVCAWKCKVLPLLYINVCHTLCASVLGFIVCAMVHEDASFRRLCSTNMHRTATEIDNTDLS